MTRRVYHSDSVSDKSPEDDADLWAMVREVTQNEVLFFSKHRVLKQKGAVVVNHWVREFRGPLILRLFPPPVPSMLWPKVLVSSGLGRPCRVRIRTMCPKTCIDPKRCECWGCGFYTILLLRCVLSFPLVVFVLVAFSSRCCSSCSCCCCFWCCCDCWLFVVCFVICVLLFVFCCLLFVVCCLLFVVCCLLFVCCWFIGCCLFVVVCVL